MTGGLLGTLAICLAIQALFFAFAAWRWWAVALLRKAGDRGGGPRPA